MSDIRDTYKSWADVPAPLKAAVDAYDAARIGDRKEAPMSETNKASIAPLIQAAVRAYAIRVYVGKSDE